MTTPDVGALVRWDDDGFRRTGNFLALVPAGTSVLGVLASISRPERLTVGTPMFTDHDRYLLTLQQGDPRAIAALVRAGVNGAWVGTRITAARADAVELVGGKREGFLVMGEVHVDVAEHFDPAASRVVKKPGSRVYYEFWRCDGPVPEGYERREVVYYVPKNEGTKEQG